jgi:predicted unusual protein kinase regulating ubiquinone biosynthesis (AarF/ABC1/UbiB family)
VHAAKLHDGTDVVVKVQYPGVADALRADLDDDAFIRKLAGAEIGKSLDHEAIHALAAAVRCELDYLAEADIQTRFANEWDGDTSVRIPRVIRELSSARVLTMTRARGKSLVDTAAGASPDVRAQAAAAIYKFAWGSPLVHGLLNADPNPGNFLVEPQSDGHVVVHCLDFGCALALTDEVRDADRAIWQALLDDDASSAAERFRMALNAAGVLLRADTLATAAHREWERALALPLMTHGTFHWNARYAADFAETTGRVLAGGGVALPARVLLLWRQRLGVASVLGMLDGTAAFRRVLYDLVGSGKRALR